MYKYDYRKMRSLDLFIGLRIKKYEVVHFYKNVKY